MLNVAGFKVKTSVLVIDWPLAKPSSIRERTSGPEEFCLLLSVSNRDLTFCDLDFRIIISSTSSGSHNWECLPQVKQSTFRIILYLPEAASELSQSLNTLQKF